MIQMDLLVTNVTELLTSTVDEVLRLIGQAVFVSQEESARLRQENQKLQHKLEELQTRLKTDVVPHVSFPGGPEESLFMVHHEQALEGRLEQEARVSSEKEGTEAQNLTFKEEKSCRTQSDPEDQRLNTTWLPKPSSPTFNSPPKSRSGLSQTFSKPSPNTPAAPQCVILDNIKVEPNPEPPECARVGQSDGLLMDSSASGDTGHSEPTFFLQDQHAHVLSSRVENLLDAPPPSCLRVQRETAHTCHLCGKTLSTSSSLTTHFICHSNERPFACRACNFRFSRMADLKKHQRIHTGERPYNCRLCGRSFNRTENLRRHLRKLHHGALL